MLEELGQRLRQLEGRSEIGEGERRQLPVILTSVQLTRTILLRRTLTQANTSVPGPGPAGKIRGLCPCWSAMIL